MSFDYSLPSASKPALTAALGAWSLGQHTLAAAILCQALKRAKSDKYLDFDLLGAAVSLGEFFDAREMYSLAELLFSQVIETAESVLGAEHHAVQASRNAVLGC